MSVSSVMVRPRVNKLWKTFGSRSAVLGLCALGCSLGAAACSGASDTDDGASNGISDVCSDPASDTMLDGWEVGLVAGSTFTPLGNDAVVPITYGGQGLPMFGLYVQARGSAVPACLAQETYVYNDADAIAADLRSPLTMRRQDDGTYRSGAAWLILYEGVLPGDHLTIRSTAGQKMFERSVYADMRGATPAVLPARSPVHRPGE